MKKRKRSLFNDEDEEYYERKRRKLRNKIKLLDKEEDLKIQEQDFNTIIDGKNTVLFCDHMVDELPKELECLLVKLYIKYDISYKEYFKGNKREYNLLGWSEPISADNSNVNKLLDKIDFLDHMVEEFEVSDLLNFAIAHVDNKKYDIKEKEEFQGGDGAHIKYSGVMEIEKYAVFKNCEEYSRLEYIPKPKNFYYIEKHGKKICTHQLC